VPCLYVDARAKRIHVWYMSGLATVCLPLGADSKFVDIRNKSPAGHPIQDSPCDAKRKTCRCASHTIRGLLNGM
jgi:hypothetical protein